MESTKPTKSSVQFHPFILLGLNIQQEQLMHSGNTAAAYSFGAAAIRHAKESQAQVAAAVKNKNKKLRNVIQDCPVLQTFDFEASQK